MKEENNTRKYNRIDWKNNIRIASEWIEKCREIGITPTASQMQKHFGWTNPVAYKVKSFISIMNEKNTK